MTQETERPRPVVDAAGQQKRRSDVIGAIAAVLAGIPIVLLSLNEDLMTAQQVSGITVFLGLLTGAALVIFARQDLKTALGVETQVTPSSDPMDDAGVPLVPIADDFLED